MQRIQRGASQDHDWDRLSAFAEDTRMDPVFSLGTWTDIRRSVKAIRAGSGIQTHTAFQPEDFETERKGQ